MVGNPFAETTKMPNRAANLDGQRSTRRNKGIRKAFKVKIQHRFL